MVHAPHNGIVAGVRGVVQDRDLSGSACLRTPTTIPVFSHHRGSKFNARRRAAADDASATTSGSVSSIRSGGFHSTGPRGGGGAGVKQPLWRTTPGRETTRRPRSSPREKSSASVSWADATLDLRNHRRRPRAPHRSLSDRRDLAREAAWDGAHATASSKFNAAYPRSRRSYFRDPRELGRDGAPMGTRPSSVWRTRRAPSNRSFAARVEVGDLSLFGGATIGAPGSLERPATSHAAVDAGAMLRLADVISPVRRPRRLRPETAPL